MSDGPFKLRKDGVITGPIPLTPVPGMPPGTVLINVDLLNRLYRLGQDAGRMEDAAMKRRQKDRIRTVIADIELDTEPPPDFAALRKKPV